MNDVKLLAPFRRKSKFLQQHLFEAALSEMGVPLPQDFRVDHQRGLILVGDEAVELLYPFSWIRRMNAIPRTKRHRYSFIGAITESGGRAAMLAPFQEAGHLVLETLHQRGPAKGSFDQKYFTTLRETEFALCPNHLDWPGPPEYAWTYRFVEAALVGAIPVCFRESPLGARFVRDYRFVWADQPQTHTYSLVDARHNLRVALDRHVVPTTRVATWVLADG